jgi:hypothetical protein
VRKTAMPKVTCVMAGSNWTRTASAIVKPGNMIVSSLLSGLRRRMFISAISTPEAWSDVASELPNIILMKVAWGGKSRSKVIENQAGPLLNAEAVHALSATRGICPSFVLIERAIYLLPPKIQMTDLALSEPARQSFTNFVVRH